MELKQGIRYPWNLPPQKAAALQTELSKKEKIIGAAVRTLNQVKPVYVSVGDRMNLKDSIHLILQCCDKYRLPEPTRRADKLARKDRSS